MSARIAYLVAAASALYMAATPALSNLPGRPLSSNLLFWMSAVCLFAASAVLPNRQRDIAAFLGSALALAVYAYSILILPALRLLGHSHLETRLVAVKQTWFDQWRPLLDLPFAILLLASSILCLWLSARSLTPSHHQEG